MPYPSLVSLPAWVKKMPVGAQKIWRSTWNSAYVQYKDETRAFKIAISAVKRKYRKVGDGWVKKELSTPSYIQGSAMVRENLAGSRVRANPKKKPKK